MHSRIDQLLSVLDREPVDATVHAHLEQCDRCGARLSELCRNTEALRALPELEPPRQSWAQIAARLPLGQRRPQRHTRAAIAAMAAGALGLIIAVNEWRDPQTTQLAVMTQPDAQRSLQPTAASRQQLMQRSRELERQLDYLPQRPAVERPAFAITVDVIEQRVQWLDWRLSSAPEARLNEEQERVLWRERVALMDSLVKLRYAQSGGSL